MNEDSLAFNHAELALVVAAIADDHACRGLVVLVDQAVRRCQHPLLGDERAAAEACVCVHRIEQTHLPRPSAISGGLATDDELAGDGRACRRCQPQRHVGAEH